MTKEEEAARRRNHHYLATLEQTQTCVFNHLIDVARTQVSVRRCEVEGMVYDIEKQFEATYSLGLITMSQLDELLNVLRHKERSTNEVLES